MKHFTHLIIASLLIITTCGFSQNQEIYVSDAANFNIGPWKILKFDANGQNPVTFIDTNLAWPQDILFLEDQGTVLISNLNTGIISKYNASTGTYQSNFATGIGGPTRMKIGADSLLYVLQWSGNGKVKRYQLNGTFVDDFTSVGVSQGIGIDWDSVGNLYVSSYGGGSVRKFDTNGDDQGLFINANLAGPTNIWFDTNGDLLVTDYNGTAVKRFDPNGILISNFITGLGYAEGVAIYPNGNILIGNGATSSVKLFDSNGSYLSEFIASGAGGLITPNAVVIRDVITSVPPVIYLDQNFVTPTFGNVFQISAISGMDILEVAVYHSEGKLVFQTKVNGVLVWEAGNYPDGLYLVVAKMSDGHEASQKIVVNNSGRR